MKKILFLFVTLCITITTSGQTVNYALNNADGNGYVVTSRINELDDSAEATFQLWIKPDIQTGKAQLLSQNNFSLYLDGNRLTLESGQQTASVDYTFAKDQWAQITVTVQQGTVKFYINNTELSGVNGLLPQLFSASNNNLRMGEGFKGLLDEIRIWKKALPQANFYWRNTLNKFNPNQDHLVAYWKGDQELCENLVDYTLKHHGVFHNVTRTPVTDNTQFRYLISTGYTNLIRFIDRGNIDRDMFLMTNDLILLTGKIQKDGTIVPEYADNTGVPTKVEYLEEYEGRKGIMNFQGDGAQLYSEEGEIAYTADSKFGRDEPTSLTVQGWFYIESWKDGALIFSKRKDADNCLEIRMGAEATKDIILELNGTKATMSGKVETGKWQYLAFYFSPKVVDISNPRVAFSILTASVDYKKYTAATSSSGITLSGNNMTIGRVPRLENTPLLIGKDFDGKIDELMVWGTDRFSSVESDSKNPYILNIGSWNNLFLTAYWKGDDAQNVGKDSQSYRGMIEFMRNYYANHRGMKIRLGIIYPDGDNWKNVLNQKANVDRLIASANRLLSDFDGIDVDLEWHNYNVLNPVIRRLIDEVMAGKDDKIFTVSQHEYSHTLAKELLTDPGIDYFTMQVYGPQPFSYGWDFYESAYNKFIAHGYPKEKLLMSYGILLVDGSEEGYKDLFEKYYMNDSNFDPNLNQWQCGAGIKYFNGVNQIKRKQDFILDKGCQGTMYFDMGNDVKVSDHKSLIRAQNEIISANVDTLITKVVIDPTAIGAPSTKDEKFFSVIKNADKRITIVLNEEPEAQYQCLVYQENGALTKEFKLSGKDTTINLEQLSKGIYLIKVVSNNRTATLLYNL